MTKVRVLAALMLVACSLPTYMASPENAASSYTNAAVVSVDPIASNVGIDILKKGGNAVDAAVATAFALAVTWPAAGNLGGGGFIVYRDHQGKVTTFDFREKAPLAANP